MADVYAMTAETAGKVKDLVQERDPTGGGGTAGLGGRQPVYVKVVGMGSGCAAGSGMGSGTGTGEGSGVGSGSGSGGEAYRGLVCAWNSQTQQWVDTEKEVIVKSATGATLNTGTRYLGLRSGLNNCDIWEVVVTTGGGGGPFLARITAEPTPVDDPPAGLLGDTYIPPRFSYHVYSFEGIDYNEDSGQWVSTGVTGVGYRSPSSQWPPTKIITGQSVMAQESAESPGAYILTPWGSQRSTTITITTGVDLACVDGSPVVITYRRPLRIFARDLCISQPTSGE